MPSELTYVFLVYNIQHSVGNIPQTKVILTLSICWRALRCFRCVHVCLTAAGKSTFVQLLQGASEEWEVIPEPIGKWCNVKKDGDDIYQVNL